MNICKTNISLHAKLWYTLYNISQQKYVIMLFHNTVTFLDCTFTFNLIAQTTKSLCLEIVNVNIQPVSGLMRICTGISRWVNGPQIRWSELFSRQVSGNHMEWAGEQIETPGEQMKEMNRWTDEEVRWRDGTESELTDWWYYLLYLYHHPLPPTPPHKK